MVTLFYIIILVYTSLQDLNNKYIYAWSFHFLTFTTSLFYYDFYWYINMFIFLLMLSLIIFILDLYTILKKEIKILWKDWMLFNTWLYDYFLYIFIIIMIGSHFFYGLETWNFIFNFWIIFISLLLWWLIGFLLNIFYKNNTKQYLYNKKNSIKTKKRYRHIIK